VKRTSIIALMASIVFLAVAPAATPAESENVRGWNVTAHGSWGSDWLFADAIRKASGFGSGWRANEASSCTARRATPRRQGNTP